MGFIGRIIYFIGGLITALLGLRFIFALLGANPSNAFVDFIYRTSQPLVAPFFNVFNYQPTLGQSHLEVSTLVAMLVYGIIFGLVGMLLGGGRQRI